MPDFQTIIPKCGDRSKPAAISSEAERIAREVLEESRLAKTIAAFAEFVTGAEPRDPNIFTPSDVALIRAEIAARRELKAAA